MPKITVIIPVHNMEKYLATCLNSVLSQSFSDIEIICINDASQDASLDILNAYTKKDLRIRIIDCKENIGAAKARNLGIEQALGEFIALCDADDAYTPYTLETLLSAIQEFKTPVSCGNVISIDESFKNYLGVSDLTMCTRIFRKEKVIPKDYPPLWLPFNHPRFLFSKFFLQKHQIQYIPFKRGEDPPFLAKVLSLADHVAVCPEIVYIRREVRTKLKKAFVRQSFIDYINSIELCCHIFKKNGLQHQADLYKAFTMKESLELREWLNYPKEHKILLRREFPRLLQIDKDTFLAQAFTPYNLNPKKIANAVQSLQKPLWIVTLLRVWDFFQSKVAKR